MCYSIYPMVSPMMMGYGCYCGGNEYVNMRSRYGYPYASIDYPPAPGSSIQRDPHAVVERNRFLNFMKKIFK